MSGRKYCSNKRNNLLDVGLEVLIRANCRPFGGLTVGSFFALKNGIRGPPIILILKIGMIGGNKSE